MRLSPGSSTRWEPSPSSWPRWFQWRDRPPSERSRSTSTTFLPSLARIDAAHSPAVPAPTTTTSAFMLIPSSSRAPRRAPLPRISETVSGWSTFEELEHVARRGPRSRRSARRPCRRSFSIGNSALPPAASTFASVRGDVLDGDAEVHHARSSAARRGGSACRARGTATARRRSRRTRRGRPSPACPRRRRARCTGRSRSRGRRDEPAVERRRRRTGSRGRCRRPAARCGGRRGRPSANLLLHLRDVLVDLGDRLLDGHLHQLEHVAVGIDSQ